MILKLKYWQAGDTEGARRCLGRAVTVQPEEGHAKFLSLAQLFQGKEALQLYGAGIGVMRAAMEKKKGEEAGELATELSNAHCACAELFMTDLCDESDAEEQCKANIASAEEADPANPEAKQTRARYLLIKSQFDDAKKAILESLSLWLPKYQAVLENKQGADPVECCPLLYTTRLASAKILIELELWDEAVQVLEGLLEEDDQVVDTWYLLGWLNRLRAAAGGEEGYDGNARFYLKRALEVNSAKQTDDSQMVW